MFIYFLTSVKFCVFRTYFDYEFFLRVICSLVSFWRNLRLQLSTLFCLHLRMSIKFLLARFLESSLGLRFGWHQGSGVGHWICHWSFSESFVLKPWKMRTYRLLGLMRLSRKFLAHQKLVIWTAYLCKSTYYSVFLLWWIYQENPFAYGIFRYWTICWGRFLS